MNLFDILNNAQGGNGLDALAKQFGLSQQQTQQAVEALMPAFSQGFRQSASNSNGLGSLLSMLGSGHFANYFEDANKAFSPQGTAEGNSILGQLFGSKDLSRAVAAQASQATGIGQDILKQMLPAVASMLMGGLFKQSNSKLQAGSFGAANPLGEIIEQMMRNGQGQTAPQGAGNNPLGDILGQILRGGGAQQGQPMPQQGSSDNPLGDILGQILRGGGAQPNQPTPQSSGDNPLGDILGQILRGGGAQQGQPMPQQGSGDNPLGDILGQILRGGGAQGMPQEDEPRMPPQRRAQPQARPQEEAANNPLEDIFGKMFNPGGQQTEEYQKGVDNIFDQFRRGVDRQTR